MEQFKSHLRYKILSQLDSSEDLELKNLIFNFYILFPIKDEEEIQNLMKKISL